MPPTRRSKGASNATAAPRRRGRSQAGSSTLRESSPDQLDDALQSVRREADQRFARMEQNINSLQDSIATIASALTAPSINTASSSNTGHSHQIVTPPLPSNYQSGPSGTQASGSSLSSLDRAAVAVANDLLGEQHEWPVYGHVDVAVLERVRKLEAIDLRLLLRDSADESLDEKAKGKPKPPLSPAEWRRAYNIFSAVLLKAHPQYIDGVFAHGERVVDMMDFGDWRRYDADFRRAISNGRGAWGRPNVALQQICQRPAAPSASQRTPGPPFQNFPAGFCYGFHSRTGCSRNPCRYSHNCPNCRQGHKAFECPDRPSRRQPKGSGGRGQHRGSQ